MPIIKSIITPNGATVAFHKATNAQVDYTTGTAIVNVSSWSDEASYLAGRGQVWSWPVLVSAAGLADVDATIPAVAPFDGGVRVGDGLRTLQNRIDIMRAEIKASRDQRKDGGTLVAGKWFHSDGPSRIQQLALVVMGSNVPAVQWKSMDGSFITMTPAIAMGIFQATAVLDTTLFANAEAHLAAVSASTEPETHDWSTGWPEHFQA